MNRSEAIMAKFFFVLVFCIGVLGIVGCGKRESGTSAPQTPAEAAADPFNLTGVRNAFAKASPGLQVIIDEAMGSVRAGDYASAVRQFEAISQRKDLTQEQRKALEELIGKLRTAAPAGSRR